MFFLFISRPTPSCGFSLICGPQTIPRPQGVGGAGGDDDSVASVMMIAGEYTFPIRSLAPARSLLPHSLRWAWMRAIFPSSFFRCPIRGRRLR